MTYDLLEEMMDDLGSMTDLAQQMLDQITITAAAIQEAVNELRPPA